MSFWNWDKVTSRFALTLLDLYGRNIQSERVLAAVADSVQRIPPADACALFLNNIMFFPLYIDYQLMRPLHYHACEEVQSCLYFLDLALPSLQLSFSTSF
jgi:hypothetical protein